jgi:hypothetical protein
VRFQSYSASLVGIETKLSSRYSGAAKQVVILAQPNESLFWLSQTSRHSGAASRVVILAQPESQYFVCSAATPSGDQQT